MKTIELIGQVDDQHRLFAQVPPEVRPGIVKFSVILEPLPPDEDDAGHEWTDAVAREWANELADSNQDIYTLSDGEPVDAR